MTEIRVSGCGTAGTEFQEFRIGTGGLCFLELQVCDSGGLCEGIEAALETLFIQRPLQ